MNLRKTSGFILGFACGLAVVYLLSFWYMFLRTGTDLEHLMAPGKHDTNYEAVRLAKRYIFAMRGCDPRSQACDPRTHDLDSLGTDTQNLHASQAASFGPTFDEDRLPWASVAALHRAANAERP